MAYYIDICISNFFCSIKFQSITTPDGMIACLYGPWVCKRGDARILRESGLVDQLEEMMPLNEGVPIYALYGDLAYPLSAYILKVFLNVQPGSIEAAFNKRMLQSRIAVEWGFCGILSHRHYVGSQRDMMLLKMLAGVNATFMTNLRQCFHGNTCFKHFGLTPPTLGEYLSMID